MECLGEKEIVKRLNGDHLKQQMKKISTILKQYNPLRGTKITSSPRFNLNETSMTTIHNKEELPVLGFQTRAHPKVLASMTP